MRRIVCASALICVMCFMGALNAAAVSSGSYGDIDIAIDRPRDDKTSHGYISYSIQVQNRSADKMRRVKISIEPDETALSHEERIKSVSRTIEVAPNATVRTRILQPNLNPVGRPLKAAVWIDGQKQMKPLRLDGFSRIRLHSIFIMTPDLTLKNKEPAVAVDDAQRLRPPPYPKSLSIIQRRDLEPDALLYRSLDGILLSLEDVEALSVKERGALWDYVKGGGSLAVTGGEKLPDEWKRLDARLENSAFKSRGIERYEIGFGLLLLTAPLSRTSATRYQLYDLWKETQQPWNATYSSSGANVVLPVAEPYDAQASYRRMFFLMLILAALIGPVNIFLFRRIERRMNLYWTVPAVSLLACVLLVFLYAVIDSDKYMRVCSLTYLDQGAGSASTIGWVGFYSPSAHPDGLLFDEETELALQASPDRHLISALPAGGASIASTIPFKSTHSKPTGGSPPKPAPGATPPSASGPVKLTVTFHSVPSAPAMADEHAVGSIDWTDGQRWSGEWIKPRTPLHFKFRKIQKRSERIDLKRNGGKLKVVNRLGADLKAFWYADHDGKLYQASNIRNGGEAVLTETKGVPIGGKTLRQLYISQDWVPEIEAAQTSPATYLQPGRYLAELTENVFLEKAMEGAKMKPSTCIVVGELEQGE